MSDSPRSTPLRYRALEPAVLGGRERYQLLTSLVVPRPIGWISTWGPGGEANLAPYSFFSALSSSPMLVGVSVGHRQEGPKDTLLNVRERGAFCVNVVSLPFLEAMNATSADVPRGVDEFDLVGLPRGTSSVVDAPFVVGAPAVLECSLTQEVELQGAPNTLVIGRVDGVLVDDSLPFVEGTLSIVPESLLPVGRLWGAAYALPGPVRVIPRPTA